MLKLMLMGERLKSPYHRAARYRELTSLELHSKTQQF